MQSIFSLIHEALDFSVTVPDIKRRKRLLDFMLLTMVGVIVLAWLNYIIFVYLMGNSINEGLKYALIGMPFLVLILLVIFWLNQRQTGYWASILFVAIIFLGCLLDEPQQVAVGRSLIYFSIPIVLSSLVISPSASFFVALIATVVNGVYVYFASTSVINVSAIFAFFVLALITWLATSRLELTIKHLASMNLALRESEERYRTLVEMTPDMIALSQPDGTFEMVNNAVLETVGYDNANDLIGEKSIRFIHPDDRMIFDELGQHIATAPVDRPQIVEFRVVKKDGSQRWVELKSAPIKNPLTGQVNSFLGIGRDITLRKQAEQELRVEKDRLEDTVRESEAAYQSLVDNSDQGLLLFQGDRVLKANRSFARICNLSLQEIYTADVPRLSLLIHPDERERTLVQIRKVVREKESVLRFETRLLLEEGQVRWVELILVSISFMGKPAIQITVLDRTERKQAELALARSEERYRALAEAAQDMIFIIDKNGQVRYVNQYAANLFDKHPEDLIGEMLEHLFPPAIYQRQRENIQKVLETGTLHYVENESVFPGGTIWLSTWLVPLKDPQDRTDTVLGISRNINQLKQLELSLREAKDGLEARVAERTAELNDSREQMRELTRQIVTVQEDERRRVSRELHDEAGQTLIGLKYRLGEALSSLPSDYEDARQRIGVAMDATDLAMAKIRSLAHDLRPPSLDVAGISLSLQGYCREFSEKASLSVDYRGTDLPGLSDEISISLYRILQEGLTNIVRHAPQATLVDVTLSRSRSALTLSIADNGPGYQPQPERAGIGILGIQERLALLGGHLNIQSNGRKGTRLKAVIPLPEQMRD